LADYNYENISENNDFDQSHGQNLLNGISGAMNRTATIVSPMRPRGLNYTSLRNSAIKRDNEEATPNPDKKEGASSGAENNTDNKKNETKKSSSAPNNLGKAVDKIAGGKKAATVAGAFLKANKMKLVLIGGAVFFGIIFIFIIFFTVFVSSGTESTGGAFLEVSDYELNTNDEETTTETSDDTVNN